MADINYYKVLVLEPLIVIYKEGHMKEIKWKMEMKRYLGMNLGGPDLNACTNATVTGQWRELRHKQEKALWEQTLVGVIRLKAKNSSSTRLWGRQRKRLCYRAYRRTGGLLAPCFDPSETSEFWLWEHDTVNCYSFHDHLLQQTQQSNIGHSTEKLLLLSKNKRITLPNV